MPTNRFVPNDFEIPATLETDRFRLQILSLDDVEKDYEAVIESRELLHTMFGGPWPRPGFTLKENFADLEKHQQEFLAVSILTPQKLPTQTLLWSCGCVRPNTTKDWTRYCSIK